jgi:hypothetical protein
MCYVLLAVHNHQNFGVYGSPIEATIVLPQNVAASAPYCNMTALAAAEGCHGAAAIAERHFSMLAAALESIEGRSEALASRLAAAEAEAATYKARCAEHTDIA